MSDPKDLAPDDELLEFLGGGDDLAEDVEDEGFLEFLAENEVGDEDEKSEPEQGEQR
jgi:hypothetical protein